MPTRSSSRPSSSSAAANSDLRRAIAYHATSITVLWVVIIAMSIGLWLTMLVNMVRLDAMDAKIGSLAQQAQADSAKMQVSELQRLALPPTVPVAPVPATQMDPMASMSGLLVRGALSPDGTRYAGYDDTTKGKIGIGVEIQATKTVKHIVIFNPNEQTTGKGTPQESTLSVRWKDANTIEYDYLSREGGLWVKQTQSVQIFF